MRGLVSLGLALCCAASAAAQQLAAHHVSNHDRDRAQRLFVDGGKAITAHDMQAAVNDFSQAVALDPSTPDYDAALAIARDNLATELMQQALKARDAGDQQTFRTRMQQAAAEDTRNPLVMEHAKEFADAIVPEAAVVRAPYDDAAPPVALAPTAGTHSFHLRLPEGEILRQVLAAWGITPSIDISVGSDVIPFDADAISFDQAEAMLTLATNTFFVPLDPHRTLVALDSKENRTTFERLALETLYLPGLTPDELSDVSNIARNLFAAQQVTLREANSTITLRAPERQMQAFNFEVNELLAGRSQVLLQVDMYDVQRNFTSNEGVEPPQTSTIFNVDSEVQNLLTTNASLVQQIISSGLASSGNLEEIALAIVASGQAGSSILSSPFATFGGGLTLSGLTLNGVSGNVQLNDSRTYLLDQVQLHLEDQEEGVFKVGESYPIVTSSYTNLVTGSTAIPGISSAGLSSTLQNLGISASALSAAATTAVPQVQYQDIGLNLTATPRVEVGGAISLKLHFELSSLSGATLDSNPIINNRQTDSILTVQPGQQTVVTSQLSNQETAALTGYPFLSEIPGFGAMTNHDITKMHEMLVIVITPRVLRLGHTHREGGMVLLPTHS